MRDSTRVLTSRPGLHRPRCEARGTSGPSERRKKKGDENRERERRKGVKEGRRETATGAIRGNAQRYTPHRLGIHEYFKRE